jgi:hypothetical protein
VNLCASGRGIMTGSRMCAQKAKAMGDNAFLLLWLQMGGWSTTPVSHLRPVACSSEFFITRQYL